jgi:hypothetical protein
MFPQPKKWPGAVAAMVIVIVLYRNPEGAAHLVNGTISAISRFAAGLRIGV